MLDGSGKGNTWLEGLNVEQQVHISALWHILVGWKTVGQESLWLTSVMARIEL